MPEAGPQNRDERSEREERGGEAEVRQHFLGGQRRGGAGPTEVVEFCSGA